MSTKAIVLHSGGMDSTVCLLRAKEEGREVVSLGIDYGQRAQVELRYGEKLCEKFGIPRRVLTLRWDKPQRHIPMDRSPEEMSRSVSSAFLPGRNVLFLILGCAEAAGIGASEVWIGINCVDYSGYPDCRKEFVDAFRHMIRLGIPDGPTIVTPLLNMSKSDIAREAKRFGLKADDTWSCYKPVKNRDQTKPCGGCDGCVLHAWAWENIPKNQQLED